MGKILSGVLMIVLVVASATATAYAAFTATADVTNISFAAGTPGLQVQAQDDPDLGTTTEFTTSFGENVYPGYSSPVQTLTIENSADSAVTFDIFAQLTSATGDYDTFKDVAHVIINGVDHTLAEWNSVAQGINLSLASGASVTVDVQMYISADATNAISGKSVSTDWVITGVQQ